MGTAKAALPWRAPTLLRQTVGEAVSGHGGEPERATGGTCVRARRSRPDCTAYSKSAAPMGARSRQVTRTRWDA
ncbi:MAG: hypothetical protein M3353_06490 [Actinomycetota bacterium]|nr:hypothetical protein [Actinomycetota bacterium]